MVRWLTAIFAALVLLVLSSTAGAATSTAESALLKEMNAVRAAHGLPPLHSDAHLERAARSHTTTMLATGVFRHGAFGSRMRRFDVRGRVAGENLAWGSGTRGSARAIVVAWLASPEHRANLLRRSFTRVGVGDRVGAFQGQADAHVVTADFAG
ncbi:MAG TPA: CAP domain-containing protein [Gaiellaceae bacterium]|nr:CAP domain-containing protein [Gaiellaceae bacterium]